MRNRSSISKQLSDRQKSAYVNRQLPFAKDEKIMASLPAVYPDLHGSSNTNEAMAEAASVEEREGIGMLAIIIFGILTGALAAAVLANALVAWSS